MKWTDTLSSWLNRSLTGISDANQSAGEAFGSFLLALRNRHFAIIDLALLTLTPVISLALRVNFPWVAAYLPLLVVFTFLSLCVKLFVFYRFKLYTFYWRFASVDELVTIIFSVGVTTLVTTGIFWIVLALGPFAGSGFPRSLPLIDGLLTLVVVGGSRFSIRAVEYWQTRNLKRIGSKRILIVGAGSAGAMVAREAISSRLAHLQPVGFVDDDPRKIGSSIHGLHVLGPLTAIPRLVRDYDVQEVVIAIPTASGGVVRNIVALCQAANVPSRTIPALYEILSGQASVDTLRKVEIEDLLRRDPVQGDYTNVAQMLAGRRVLVTGAGGSIGGELCRQILAFQPAQLILLGHGENTLFFQEIQLLKLRNEMAQSPSIDLRIVVADIRDIARMDSIFSKYTPEIVFHAAAHKHVPMMEENPEEAVTNNILGTRNLVTLAEKYRVERFVLISTDKAVNPVNIMGMTKRAAELIVQQAANKTGRAFVSVRFGNVLGSRGSVVPVFQEQIASGGPVTVTHPEMTRFFMTIPEAVHLVIQAASMGFAGDVFILDMGEPVKIVDLVRDMIELSGRQAGIDIEIVYTGLRPGEKLYEELFIKDETPHSTEHEKIFVAHGSDLPGWVDFDMKINELIHLAQTGQTVNLRKSITDLISTTLASPINASLNPHKTDYQGETQSPI